MQVHLHQALHVHGDGLGVALLLEESGGHTQANGVQAHLVELAARNLEARLIVDLRDGLGLGVQEPLLLHGDTKVGLARPANAAAGNADLGQREQPLSRGDSQEVVHRFGRGAPATGRDKRVTFQVRLVRGGVDGGGEAVRVPTDQVLGNVAVEVAQRGRVGSGAVLDLLHGPDHLAGLHAVERLGHVLERGDAGLVARNTRSETEPNLGGLHLGGVVLSVAEVGGAERPNLAAVRASGERGLLVLGVDTLGVVLGSLVVLGGSLGTLGGVLVALSTLGGSLGTLVVILGVQAGTKRLGPLGAGVLVGLHLVDGRVNGVEVLVQRLQFDQLLVGGGSPIGGGARVGVTQRGRSLTPQGLQVGTVHRPQRVRVRHLERVHVSLPCVLAPAVLVRAARGESSARVRHGHRYTRNPPPE